MAKNKNQYIELRSEKVQNIVGQIPPRLLRNGISIIFIIISLALLIAYFVPYKEYETHQTELYCRPAYQVVKMAESGKIYLNEIADNVYNKQQIGYIENTSGSITKLYSKLNGKIILNCQNGDYLEQNDIIFHIMPDSINQIYGISYIKSNKVNKIEINQKVIFSPDDNNETIEGNISKIYSIELFDTINNFSSQKIEINFTNFFINKNPTNSFRIGMRGYVKILISEKPVLKRVFEVF